jgi:ankyrin repeat protein
MDTLLQRSMLSRAAERGDAATVALLLEYEYTDPNLRDNDGLVPLAWAARGGHDDVISMLLQKNEIDLNAQLIGSISSTTVMEEENSYEFKPSLRKGQTAVSHAAEMGYRNTVEILLDRGAAIDAPDDFGKTPLMYAMHRDDIAMVRLLLSRGANPNSFNRLLETPLIMAVKDRKIEIALILLASHGIDPSWDHESGHSAIWWAVLKNDIETLELLRQTGQVDQNIREDAALLPMAARVGNEAAVRWLIDQEGLIDPDRVIPADGRSALCCAALAGHSEILKLLLSTYKVDVCRKDTRGRSIISWAGTGEITRILLDAGANPNDQDCDGRSPLSLAVEQRQRNKVDILLQHPRTNVNLADNAGNTPLYYAGGRIKGPARREIMAGWNVPESSTFETTEQEAQAMAMAELLISHGSSARDSQRS